MQRSTVNVVIWDVIAFLEAMHFKLPFWDYCSPQRWKENRERIAEILAQMLGCVHIASITTVW